VPTRRAGFTLIELLVVIAIIAVLIALLVPAVQRVREAAARTQCQNNLKQLATGMHGYHDAHKKFPYSYYLNLTHVNGDWGWGTAILPHMEQGNMYNLLDPGDFKGDLPPVSALTQTTMSVFICPTDPTGPLNTKAKNYAKSNYPVSAQIVAPFNPALGADVVINFTHITDGSSNTFMFGERDMYKGVGAIWIGRLNGITDAMVYGRADLPLNTPFAGGADPNCTRHAWTSMHSPGGGNFAFCDASVRFIKESIESDVGYTNSCPGIVNTANFLYQNLYRRNDGNVLTDFP